MSTLRRPLSIIVGALRYPVKWVANDDEIVSDDGEQLLGQCDYDNLVVRVRRGSQEHVVLIHEIIHALLFSVGRFDLSANERFVHALGTVMCQALQQSPGLLEYLIATRRGVPTK